MNRIVGTGVSFWSLMVAMVSTAGCGSNHEGDGAGSITQPVIVGADNLQYVNAYDGSRGVSKSYVASNKGPVAAISHFS